ncbi:MAG: PIN domain-containing protein, partial [Acidimicrobiales bacterium]
LDANVLVYLHDGRDSGRQKRARAVVDRVGSARTAALSAQVLGEFASVAMRKLDPPLPAVTALAQVERFRRRFPVHPVTAAVVEEALRGVDRHRLGFWDAQVWAVARLHQIPVVLGEDSRPGSLDGVRWVDPFDADLDLDEV